jgi:hypothetical protein
MNSRRSTRFCCICFVLGFVAGCLAPGAAVGQQPGAVSQLPCPRLAGVMPPGGKAGTSVDVTFSGAFAGFQFADLEEPRSLVFSHPGIKSEPIQPPPPAKPDPKAPMPQVTSFKVTIPADVPPGIYDVRFVNKWGISNPRAFVVGDLNEVMEKEPNNDVAEAQRVELNTTINGTISQPTDVDYFVFAGKKDQRVVVSCLASSIDSKLEATIEVYDAANRKIASNRLYNGTDALTDITLPADGDYYVRLYHFTHLQANNEYYYRLSVTTGPWIDAVFPSVVEPGKPTQVTVYGRNLPGGKLDPSAVADGRVLEKITATVNAPNDPMAVGRLAFSGNLPTCAAPLSGFEFRVKGPAGTSNPFLLTFAQAPLVLDNSANETAEAAQKVSVPCEIAGQFSKRRERHWYSFTAKKGDAINIELLSHRLGAPTELKFVLRNPTAKADVAESVDNADVVSLQLFARTNDPAVYRFSVPADGDYQLAIKNLNSDILFGPRQYYCVRLTPDIPDFQVAVMPPGPIMPDACRLPQNGQQYLEVYAWRQDGFNGEITLEADGLPKGVTCPPQTLSAGLRHGMLVFSAAADAAIGPAAIKVKASAMIQGRKVTREARAATISWPIQPQQNIPAITRLDREVVLAVGDPAPFSLAASLDKPAAQQGDKVNLNLKLTRSSADFKQPLVIQTVNNIQGLPPNPLSINNNQPFTLAPDKNDGTLVIEVKPTVPPGVYTIALKAQVGGLPYTKTPDDKNAKKANINVILPTTPVQLTVLPKTVATMAVLTQNPMVKAGAETEIAIKATRLFDYAGELKVQLVLPQGLTGISAAEIVIPAGQSEGKLVVKAEANVGPGAKNDLLVRATGTINGNLPVVQEVKFALNVVK